MINIRFCFSFVELIDFIYSFVIRKGLFVEKLLVFGCFIYYLD
jgi:hypothetical protein